MYDSFELENVATHCGSIVHGVDLSKPLSNRQFDEIHDALVDRVVLFFRDQQLEPADQIAFARRFGEPAAAAESSFIKWEDHPEIDILEYDADNPPHVTRDLWHTDFAGTETPRLGTCLYARDIPTDGGDTIWVNAMAAYEALSDRMKAYLEGLHAYHDQFKHYAENMRPEMYEGGIVGTTLRDEARAYQPVLHPVVRRHPVSGRRGLFVNESMTANIKDMDRRESDYLLRYLFDYLRTPEFQCRHRWRVNDFVMWDNRVSLHYALFDYTEHRLLHRVTVYGDRPHA